VDLDPRRPVGQMLGIMAERLANLWALAESLDSAMNPNTASGINLDKAVSLTGITRIPASASSVELTITGTAGTVVPMGFQVSKIGSPSIVFATIAEVTLNGGGSGTVDAVATTTGALVAEMATLTEIETPIAGVSSCTNAAAAVVGREVESDSELRVRQQEFLQAPGTSTIEGIRAGVGLVTNVTQVVVIENDTNSTDGGGRPPKSFEVVVQGGADADIADEIWNAKPAGIETFGTETEVVTDSQGVNHDVHFSRPTIVEIDITATITANTDPNEDAVYPINGDDLVKAAIMEYGATLLIGRDVFLSKIFTYINDVPGVIGIALSATADGGAPATDFLPIDVDELAEFDLSRITVVS
jgi:uncharacterized phage protein gp47/JayE